MVADRRVSDDYFYFSGCDPPPSLSMIGRGYQFIMFVGPLIRLPATVG